MKALSTPDTKGAVQQLYEEIAELQDKLHDAFNELEWIKAYLQNLQTGGGDDATYQEIIVPIATCSPDGEVVLNQATVSVDSREAALVTTLLRC